MLYSKLELCIKISGNIYYLGSSTNLQSRFNPMFQKNTKTKTS
jgi:hypothetical protein